LSLRTSLFKTLHGKLSLILLGLFCLVGCLCVPLTLYMTRTYQQEAAQKLNQPLAASLADHLAASHLLSEDSAVLRQARAEIKALMVINPNIDVYLLDAQGTVLTYSGAPEALRRHRVALVPLRRFLSASVPLPVLDDDPREAHGQAVFSVAPFPARLASPAGQASGYVYVILSDRRSNSASGLLKGSDILRSSLGLLAVLLALAFAAGLLLFQLLTRRLRWLMVSMETFRDQNFDNPDAVLTARLFTPWAGITPPRDEIDRLGLVHLQMTNRIRGQVLALAHADAARREMVSNVSHDLRTPLAALHGSLETLLIKEGWMTPQEQGEYLHAALRHSERLTKLIDDLFKLAQLDSQEVELHLELFSLDDLVQDVVQQYDLAARQKGLRLQVRVTGSLPLVSADIALIERVLDNLIDNALRHTPPGGSLDIRLTPQTGRIEVRVADTGSGIRESDLPHIFERFYRASGSQERPGSAGLGLAIVRRILELHGSTIRAESVPGSGSAFTFSLPAHTSTSVPPSS